MASKVDDDFIPYFDKKKIDKSGITSTYFHRSANDAFISKNFASHRL